MSRNSNEGYEDYKKLFDMGVELIFLKEPLINTSVLRSSSQKVIDLTIKTGNQPVDDYLKGNIELINQLIMSLCEQQIKLAFEQSQKEVDDLHQRIREGIVESMKNGTHIGLRKGTKLITKTSIKCKDIILKHSKDFNGTLLDKDVMTLCGCSKNSYYKYKKELKINF